MSEQPELEFPLEWHGKMIAEDEDHVHGEIVDVLAGAGIDAPVRRGNVSARGRYVTYNVSIVFHDRVTMESVTAAIETIRGMKMVL